VEFFPCRALAFPTHRGPSILLLHNSKRRNREIAEQLQTWSNITPEKISTPIPDSSLTLANVPNWIGLFFKAIFKPKKLQQEYDDLGREISYLSRINKEKTTNM